MYALTHFIRPAAANLDSLVHGFKSPYGVFKSYAKITRNIIFIFHGKNSAFEPKNGDFQFVSLFFFIIRKQIFSFIAKNMTFQKRSCRLMRIAGRFHFFLSISPYWMNATRADRLLSLEKDHHHLHLTNELNQGFWPR